MGLSWQQGPLGRDPIGTLLTGTPMPERVLYLEPLRRRMSVELGYDTGDARHAAWSYTAPFENVARIADLVSFYPEKVTITIDGEKLEPAPGQSVISHGPDRNLSVDEVGGIHLEEDAAAAEV